MYTFDFVFFYSRNKYYFNLSEKRESNSSFNRIENSGSELDRKVTIQNHLNTFIHIYQN